MNKYMAQLPVAEQKNLQNGLIMETAVSEYLIPLTAVRESLNFDFDTIGAATLRKGLTLIGNQLSGNILGLHQFIDSAGTNSQLLMVNGTRVYYLVGGSSWTSKRTGLNSTSKARFTTFLNNVFMVNGSEDTAVWDGNPGNGFVITGNALNAPIGKYIENFRSRVWIAGNTTYPDRVYFSSIPSSVTTPIITWDTNISTGDWLDVAPQDGENITALKRTKASLLVFKQNHIYRIYSVSESEPDPKINVGTYSAESVVETKDGVYFHHPSGFYKYADGAVQEISKPIQDIVDNISLSNYDKICSWEDGDHVYFSVGNVTIKGITYNNVVVRYTISTQLWTHRSYPKQFLVSSAYNDGSNLYRLVGDNDGNILKVNVGKTDNGTPIFYSLIHRWFNFDGLVSTEKSLMKGIFVHDGGTGANINWQNENSLPADWSEKVGQLKNYNTIFSAMGIRGRKTRFRISGTSTGEPFLYHGFEIIDGTNLTLQQTQR